MPYKAIKDGDQWKVYKVDADGKPEGKALGEHPSEAKADEQVAALYANDKPQESAKFRTGYFAELAELKEAELSEDGASARVTLIQPGWSRNSRYYSKAVLKEAAALFEGGQAYADHPGKSESKDRPERSIRDIVGWYENVKQEKDGRLTADLKLVQEWIRPIIKAAVKDNPQLAGLSINALGRTRMGEIDGKSGVIVEAIEKHNSTDIVTQPAAGGRFERLLASDSDAFSRDLIEAMPLEELTETLREVRPDLVKAWQKEWKSARDTGEVKAARAEAESLKKELAESKEINRVSQTALSEAQKELASLKRTALIDGLLRDSKLPKEWRDSIRVMLVEAKDHEAMKAILQREETKARSMPKPLKIQGAGAAVNTAAQPRVIIPTKVAAIAEALGTVPTNASTYAEYVRSKGKM